jgi:hypothetical protein
MKANREIKQGNHVDGHAKGGQKHQTSHKGDGYSECDPKGKARIQKRSQEQTHQDQAKGHIFQQQPNSAL